jgi:acetyl-CoA carboxylase biotin carboxyl carrier protein
MGITREDIDAILAAFEASEWRTIQLKADGIEVMLSKDGAWLPTPAPAPAAAPPPAAESAPAPEPATGEAGTVVAAPSLGTFYRAPKPGAPPFTDIGARVAEGDDLCLIEVMKLFTSVTAPCAGTVAAILASDGDLVEHAQPLFRIVPEGGGGA